MSQQNRWEKELAQFQEVLANPKGQAIVIVGPEGSGKSALLRNMVMLGEKGEKFHVDSKIYRVGPNDNSIKVLRDIGWPSGTVTYLGARPFLERLSSSVEEFGDLHRRVVGVDAKPKQPTDLEKNWLELIPQLPEKVKFIFTQRPDGILATNKQFMGLPNVVRIDIDALPLSDDRSEGKFKDVGQLSAAFEKFLAEKKGYHKSIMTQQERDGGFDDRGIDKGKRQYMAIFDPEKQKQLAIVEFGLREDESTIQMAWEHLKELSTNTQSADIEGYVVFPDQADLGEGFSIIQFHKHTKEMQWIFCDDFPDYEDLRRKVGTKTEDSGIEGGHDDRGKPLIDNLIDFLINEKDFPRESLSRGRAQDPYSDLTVIDPDTDIILAGFEVKSDGHDRDFRNPSEIQTNVQIPGFSGKDNPFRYRVSPSGDSNKDFMIVEEVDDENSEIISHDDFPTFNQLLFTSPLSDKGRRIYRELNRFTKYRHGFIVHTPCKDYINLKIKVNKRTVAQIHRLNDSDENIALVLAGYQEDFPEAKIPTYMFEGEVKQLSGYTSKSSGEKNWLKGNIGHQQLKYKAGVYILRPGALVDEEIQNEVGELLVLAKSNAESKGPAEPEEDTNGGIIQEIVSKILNVFGRIATLRSDEVSDVDDLGRETLTDAFADTIMHTDFNNGFTLALMGNWGEGKSSVMEILKRKLKERQKGRFDFALFNAWEYEQTGKTAAGLAQEVVKGLREKNFFKRQLQRVAFAYKENKLSLFILVGFIISPVLLYLLRQYYDPTLLTDYLKEKPNLKEFLDGLSKVAYVILPLFGIGIFKKKTEHPLDIQLQTYFKLPDYGEHLGLIPVLKRHITTLCKLKLKRSIKIPFTDRKIGRDRKLLVFVDDLDRCKSSYIAETLDAIRLVMTIPNVIVMICIDHRIAFKAIERHYRTLAEVEEEDVNRRSSAEVARDYLGKIIQLPVRLEPVKHGKLKKYVYEKLFLFEKEEWEQFKEPNEMAKASLLKDTSNLNVEKGLQSSMSEEGKGKTIVIGGKDQGFDVTTRNDDDALKKKQEKSEHEQKLDDKKSNDIEIKDRPEEGTEFYRLAGLFEFNNPRQLLRLHNSFRFLKALGRGGEVDTLDMLRMLFWQEFLHNWPVNIRGRCMAGLIDEAHGEGVKPIVKRVLDKVRADIGKLFNGENYAELAEFVRIVVLPHNEEGIFDTEEEINEWLKKKAEEKKVKEKAEGDN